MSCSVTLDGFSLMILVDSLGLFRRNTFFKISSFALGDYIQNSQTTLGLFVIGVLCIKLNAQYELLSIHFTFEMNKKKFV